MTSVAFIAMAGRGHFQRMRPLIAAFVERGYDAVVFTEPAFRDDVARDGGTFVDLYGGRKPFDADDESRPVPCRYVSFSGHYADEILRTVAATRPSIVIADSFAVIGSIAAAALDVPFVNVCSGHKVDPDTFVPMLEADPSVRISPRCHAAVAILRDRHGLEDASPFSYITSRSSLLNIYCEPAEYLTAAERRAFEPIAFFGSLPAPEAEADDAHPRRDWFGAGGNGRLSVYVSFGTVVWSDPRPGIAADAHAAAATIAEAIGARPDVRALVSLGSASPDDQVRRGLERGNVVVEPYVDQWSVLARADLYITHNGLNSTHESIWHETPMVSYPFFWDQPALAAKCQAFGFAAPLTPALRGAVTVELVGAALDRAIAQRDEQRAAIALARTWEAATIAARPTVLERIIDLL